MSTPVAGSLAVVPLYATAADALVSWDDAGATWRSLGTIPVGGGTVTSISGGTGITVSPSPIVGAGTVSLAVPVAVANGGTGTSTVFTAGSVMFAGAGGVHAQDNANLFWDDAANRLGIGTATPVCRLDVEAGSADPVLSSDANSILGVGSSSNQRIGLGWYASSPYNAWIQARHTTANVAQGLAINPLGGNVGIGTSSPNYALDVVGSARLRNSTVFTTGGTAGRSLFFSDSTPTNIAEIQSWDFDGTNYGMKFRAYGSIGLPGDVMSIVGNGNVGIGTASPGQKLDVAGNIRMPDDTSVGSLLIGSVGSYLGRYSGDGSTLLHCAQGSMITHATTHFFQSVAGGNFAYFNAAGTANLSGAWQVISARELKQEIAPYERGLDAVRLLNPVVFRYRAGTPFARSEDEPSDLLIGLVADEVEPVMPELVGEVTVTVGKEEVAVATLTPGNALYCVINSIKELVARVEQLEARL